MKKLIIVLVMLVSSISIAADNNLVDAVSYLIDREPHPKRGDLDWAVEMSNALEKAGEEYDLDPYLLAACADIESDFSPAVVSLKKLGPAGEKGILQCGKDCARNCPHFMDTAEGQALCGARWLRMAFDVCQGKGGKHSDEWAALAYYASGQYCNPPPDHNSVWKANKRIRLRDRLKNRFANSN